MIPVDNSIAGRVADVHHLLPRGGLHIVGEQFVRVNHQLLGVHGATLETDRAGREPRPRASASAAISCAGTAIGSRVVADTAGAAADVAARRRPDAAPPSRRASPPRSTACEILKSDIEDAEHNTTRFLVLAREPRHPGPNDGPVMTTFTFRVRNRPAALYKALGGFATNGVNMVKLESYVDGAFTQAEFYADIMGHPQHENVRLALRGAAVLLPPRRDPGRLPGRPVPRAGGVTGHGRARPADPRAA